MNAIHEASSHMFICGIMCLVQIPNWFSGEEIGSTKDNPFPLPDAYMAAQQRNVCFDLFSLVRNEALVRIFLTSFLVSSA